MDNNQPFDIWVCLNMGYTLMDQQIEYSIFRQTDIISPVCNILQLCMTIVFCWYSCNAPPVQIAATNLEKGRVGEMVSRTYQ